MAELARSAPAGSEERRMRWGKTALALWALVAALGLGLAGGGTAASGNSKASSFTGYAFDACNAPKVSDLAAWLGSPYRALGIYIGGVNRACGNPQLSPSWTAGAVSTGWSLIPLYVGLQAPCVGLGGVAKIQPNIASSQGTAAADDAVTDSSALALPAGSPIYFDMEGYALNSPSCTAAVQAFVVGWVNELHALGYLAGVYGSAASTMRDMQALALTGSSPDDIWIGDWDGDQSVFGDPYVSDAFWTNHQRLHQYAGGHHETWGGVTLDIDSDYVDGAVVGTAGSAPLPVTPALVPAADESAAGSVTSVDGTSTVSWPAGTFQRPTIVTLTPALPTQPVPGFGGGGYGVQLSVQQSATTMVHSAFAAPLTIHLPPRQGALAPMTSTDGANWKPLQPLFSGALPKGEGAGYSRNPDGSVDIETTASGYYALLPETSPPPAPANLTGRFDHGALVLSWTKSDSASGPAVSYRVTLGTRSILTIPGQTTAALTSIHHNAPSVYRVTATDPAGKVSEASKDLVVLPSKRPPKLPKAIPQWAFALFIWQQGGKIGRRPAAPKIPPAWYWRWYPWEAAPFHFRD